MNKSILIFFIFMSLSFLSFADDSPFYLSETAKTLAKYEEGNRVINDLKPGGKYSDVPVLELSAAEILKRAGHNGGGLKQDPSTGRYTILVNQDLSQIQKAHTVSHELQHLRDEMEFDKYLEAHPELNEIVRQVLNGVRGDGKLDFITRNREKVDFVFGAVFCQEMRAYQINFKLQRQGLLFDNAEATKDLSHYIFQSYIECKFGVTYPEERIKKMERDCSNANSFVNFMTTLVPSKPGSTATQPGIR